MILMTVRMCIWLNLSFFPLLLLLFIIHIYFNRIFIYQLNKKPLTISNVRLNVENVQWNHESLNWNWIDRQRQCCVCVCVWFVHLRSFFTFYQFAFNRSIGDSFFHSNESLQRGIINLLSNSKKQIRSKFGWNFIILLLVDMCQA